MKAEIFLAREQYGAALQYCQQSLIALVPGFTDTLYSRNPSNASLYLAPYLVEPIHLKAKILRAIYEHTADPALLQVSLDMLVDAMDAIDLARNIVSEPSKVDLTGNQRALYSLGVTTAYELYTDSQDPKYAETAFMMTEKSKNVALLNATRDLSARALGGIPDSLMQQEQELKDQIAALQKMIYDEELKPSPDQTKIARWDNQAFNIQRQYEFIIQEYEQDYPQYHNLKYQTSVVGLNDIRKQLRAREAVVQYHVGDTSLYTLYITRDNLRFTRSSCDSILLHHVEVLRSTMTPLGISNTSPETFRAQVEAGHALFQVLLQPGYDLVKGKDLLIIPDDVLGYLSFDILLTAPADKASFDYSKLPYLIRKHNISYAYLATLQYFSPTKPARSFPKAIAFAPDYRGIQNKPQEDLISLRGMEKYLLPIKHAKMEMSLLQKMGEASIFIDEEANEANFKRYAADYDIIHLAMHTVIDDDKPMYSKLVFTVLPELEEDGFLNAMEIYNMNLKARMVVLSACNTGYGKLQRGEGILSLARAFMYAGVPGIVMTLWAIEDKSGYDIMTHFYRYLAKGKARHVALRSAKMDYLKEAGRLQSHPYFWAAYVSIGDNSAVYPKNRHTTWVLVVCLLALLLIAGGILRGRRRRDSYYFFKFDKIKSALGL